MQKRLIVPLFGSLLGLVSACGPTINGAREIDANQLPRVVVEYHAEGEAPTGVRYALVQDGGKLAILKVLPGGTPLLIDRGWQDANGQHFVMWSRATEAEHILVPPQPGAPAFRWTYPPGLYTVKGEAQGQRPVPKVQFEAVTKLTPMGAK
jgi:hypothetical protein